MNKLTYIDLLIFVVFILLAKISSKITNDNIDKDYANSKRSEQ